ncbi:unnamed protein product, partial [Amoebophrya sp. A25]
QAGTGRKSYHRANKMSLSSPSFALDGHDKYESAATARLRSLQQNAGENSPSASLIVGSASLITLDGGQEQTPGNSGARGGSTGGATSSSTVPHKHKTRTSSRSVSPPRRSPPIVYQSRSLEDEDSRPRTQMERAAQVLEHEANVRGNPLYLQKQKREATEALLRSPDNPFGTAIHRADVREQVGTLLDDRTLGASALRNKQKLSVHQLLGEKSAYDLLSTK